MRFADLDDPFDQRTTDCEDDDRTDIDRKEVKAARRGKADTAKKRPGRTIDGKGRA